MPVEHFNTVRSREAKENLRDFLIYCLSLGLSQKGIADSLNSLGTKRPMGGKWQQPHVSKLLAALGLSTNRKFHQAVSEAVRRS